MDTEEGIVMVTMLAYVITDLHTSRRAAILQEFRTSGRILRLFQDGLSELVAVELTFSRVNGWLLLPSQSSSACRTAARTADGG